MPGGGTTECVSAYVHNLLTLPVGIILIKHEKTSVGSLTVISFWCFFMTILSRPR